VNLRKTIASTVVIATVSVLAGCSSGGSHAVADLTAAPDYSGKLSILTAFAGEPLEPYFNTVVDDYKKLHPGVQITLAQETDDSAIKDKEKVLIASQSLPDIYFSYAGNWGSNFATNGIAADLSSIIAPGTDWGNTFGKSSLDAFKYDGKYYGIPVMVDAKYMGYNKQIFDQVGIDVPKTFEELIADCPKLKAAGHTPIAFGNKDGWPGLHYLGQLFAYNVPRDVLEADFVPSTAKYTDPGYVKGMQQFVQLLTTCTGDGANSNGVTYNSAEQQQTLGDAAMYYQELNEFSSVQAPGSQIEKDGFGIFQLPAPAGAAGDVFTLEAAPEGFMINQKSPNAALAVDFMKFATNEKNAATFSASPFGQPSPVLGAVTDQTATPSVVEGVKLLNDAKSTVAWLDMTNVPDVADAWTSVSEGLVSGSVTPQSALDTIREAAKNVK
jgi:raffinose/stachyose/melibiose transport system substrate-binding protein